MKIIRYSDCEFRENKLTGQEEFFKIPAIGECECGKQLQLDAFTNPCGCGREYNSSGSLLAPRDQWGEETGETLADILGPDRPDFY